MKKTAAFLTLIASCMLLAIAYSGHEIPIYPSYYPQEIRIEAVDVGAAGRLLAEAKIHAYVGRSPIFADAPPEHLRRIESLGSYVVLSLARSATRTDEGAACALMQAMMRTLASAEHGLSFHPYPVTPLHAEYLHHVDLADAARRRWLTAPASGAVAGSELRVQARGALAQRLVRAHWHEATADASATLEAIEVRDLVAPEHFNLNGWSGPPWLKAAWFHGYRLLADDLGEPGRRETAERLAERLRTGSYTGEVEGANLERELLALLTAGCRRAVVGFTRKHEYFNADYSAGIENVGYDSHAGLNSAIFLRTVKLKDFPWNGWLRLGVAGAPQAAWNPIAGFDDDAGRLIWHALGDPGLFPTPYDAGWEPNRFTDVQLTPAIATSRTGDTP